MPGETDDVDVAGGLAQQRCFAPKDGDERMDEEQRSDDLLEPENGIVVSTDVNKLVDQGQPEIAWIPGEAPWEDDDGAEPTERHGCSGLRRMGDMDPTRNSETRGQRRGEVLKARIDTARQDLSKRAQSDKSDDKQARPPECGQRRDDEKEAGRVDRRPRESGVGSHDGIGLDDYRRQGNPAEWRPGLTAGRQELSREQADRQSGEEREDGAVSYVHCEGTTVDQENG